AESSRTREGFDVAQAAFAAALASPDAGRAPELAAECRYALGWCQYRLGASEEAVATFRQAARAMAHFELPPAPDAAWMAALGRLKLETQGSKGWNDAIADLLALKQQYPDHPNAQKLDELLARLRKDAPAPEPTGAAAAVGGGGAQLSLCRRLY